HLDPLVRNVTVIMTAMPAGTVTAMLAEKYGADARFASSAIFISTLLSIVSLPILAAVLF
ncbi:MAG TPA: AEC family transporter, partial [Candidatus Choladousia intestinipullorum]|nr:AEC family transporter [Candidatus Choladousia intestinipullorum]